MMKKYILLFLFALFIISSSAFAHNVANWEKMIQMFTKGDPNGMSQVATQKLTDALGEKRFEAIVAACRLRYGKFVQLEGQPEFVRLNQMTRVTQRAKYEYASLLFTCFVEQKSGLVAGFFFKPLPSGPVENKLFREETVTVGEEWPLPGLLLIPKQAKPPYPCVILVHGSGPQNRNSTVGPNPFFEEIAHALGKAGIASLRYDKRTYVYPEKVRNQPTLTLDDETVDDAVEALGKVASDPRMKNAPLFVLGHSQGAMLIPRIAKRTSLPTGYIFVAAPARKMKEILRSQTNYLTENNPTLTKEQKKKVMADFEKMLAEGEKEGRLFGQQIQKSYWKDLFGYDPVRNIGIVKCPMLFIQGGRDYQVTDSDFNLWKEALKNNPKATFIRYKDLNHLMQKGKGKSMPEEYLRKEPVSDKVTGDIAAFILKNSSGKTEDGTR